MIINIIDLDVGNIMGVYRAFNQFTQGHNIRIISNTKNLNSFDLLVLPGVSNFGEFMKKVIERNFFDCIVESYKSNCNLFGICVGFQSFFSLSDEDTNFQGFNFINKKISYLGKLNKVPNTGVKKTSKGLSVFFNHSYGCVLKNKSEFNDLCSTLNAEIDYLTIDKLMLITSIKFNNVVACQFHPEKSGVDGLNFLKENFFK